jgi:hypothetical protein
MSRWAIMYIIPLQLIFYEEGVSGDCYEGGGHCLLFLLVTASARFFLHSYLLMPPEN